MARPGNFAVGEKGFEGTGPWLAGVYTYHHYVNDTMEGETSVYKDGVLIKTAQYHKGQLHGPERGYSPKTQKLISEKMFLEGRLQGMGNTYWHKSGNLSTQAQYLDGKLAKLYHYHLKTGKLESSLHRPNDSTYVVYYYSRRLSAKQETINNKTRATWIYDRDGRGGNNSPAPVATTEQGLEKGTEKVWEVRG